MLEFAGGINKSTLGVAEKTEALSCLILSLFQEATLT